MTRARTASDRDEVDPTNGAKRSNRARMSLLGALTVAISLGSHRVIPYQCGELLLVGFLAYVLVRAEPLGYVFRSAAPGYLWFTIGLLSLILIGHLAQHSSYTFPFLPWTMYSEVRRRTDPDFEPVFFEYYAKLRSGRVVQVFPSRAVPAAGNRLTYELSDQANAIEAAVDQSARASLMEKHRATLRALAKIEDRKYVRDRIATITVYEYRIPLRSYNVGISAARRLLWVVECNDPQAR